MKIALDAMGGDNAPDAIVQGAVEAAGQISGEIILVGQEEAIRATGHSLPSNISVVHADEVVDMHDKPTAALRGKKKSSIGVAVNLVKEGEADAFVSAGNTGACTAASQVRWRQIPGVHRPAIASPFPNKHNRFVLLDAGASPDVDPLHLVEFAKMGRAYAETVMGRRNPKVHLINIGEEPGKGNAFSKEAHSLLSEHSWFSGNIEGKDIFREPCDVVVCDAFVGNVVLKTAEGVGEFIAGEMRQAAQGWKKLLFAPMKSSLKGLFSKMDYAEYGGSPLLGLNGLTMICHGRSNPKAIRNALLQTATAVEGGLVDAIRDRFADAAEREAVAS